MPSEPLSERQVAFLEKKKAERKPKLATVEKKLNDSQRVEIVKMRAEFQTYSAICKYLKETYGLIMSESGVKLAIGADKYASTFKKFRDDYLAKVKEVPIANKRVRLEDAEKVRLKLMKLIDGNQCATKEEKDELMKTVAALNETFKRSFEETEKKGIILPQYGGDFSDKSDDELLAMEKDLIENARKAIGVTTSRISGHTEGIEETGSGESA